MVMNCMLPARSGGVPEWQAEHSGEKLMMKLPAQFEAIFSDRRPLDENHGAAMAQWAQGGAAPTIDHTAAGHEAAKHGQQALDKWWKSIGGAAQRTVPQSERVKMKATATAAQAVQQPAEEEADVI